MVSSPVIALTCHKCGKLDLHKIVCKDCNPMENIENCTDANTGFEECKSREMCGALYVKVSAGFNMSFLVKQCYRRIQLTIIKTKSIRNLLLREIKKKLPIISELEIECYICDKDKCNDEFQNMQTIEDYNAKNVTRKSGADNISVQSLLICLLIIMNAIYCHVSKH
ncbi:hypothetical protein L9F63_021336 [Diploptera punctata]|uniref:Uncharacterized protein n=1 Tax=Diploptera punctata TaxID=6984 RepID=A0AAD8EBG1_DIPPU|nr:hypothetical protein L9F63_021336 [Diploptera punctata]